MRGKFTFILFFYILLRLGESQFTFTSEVATALNWKSVCSNGAGTYLAAVAAVNGAIPGALYQSNTSGSTWISQPYAASGTITSCVIGSTGQYQMVGISYAGVYTSIDYGITWLSKLYFGSGSTTLVNDLSISTSGQNALMASSLVTTGAGTVYYSSDYGATWISTTVSGSGNIFGASSDSSGQHVFVSAAGGIYRSNNYGKDGWSQVYSNGAYTIYSDIAVSSNGQYIICTAYNSPGAIIVSSNSGSAWTIKLSLANAYTVAIYSTGQFAFVGVKSGYMYQSTDYGNTWSQITSNSQAWSDIAMLSATTFLVTQDPGGAFNFFIFYSWILFYFFIFFIILGVYFAQPTPSASPTKSPSPAPTRTPTASPTKTTATWSNQCTEGPLDFDNNGYISAGWDFRAPAGGNFFIGF
jgi:photosystem II stability/assembly factor-like uncharacterized protein